MSEDKTGKGSAHEESKGVGNASSVDFKTFVFSLSSSAMYHLGMIPNPDSNQPEVNLPLARQTIDIMAMLAEKTKGNLTEEEQRTLDHLLYDLRVKFVDASKGQSG